MPKNYNIYEVQEISVDTARILAAGDTVKVKGHDVYFANLGDPFGLSALVFWAERHIHYADQFQLHFRCTPIEELRDKYLEILGNLLFTDEELCSPLADYDEYQRKNYFLHNYYGMREDKVSMFHIAITQGEAEAYSNSIAGRIFNPVTFGYYLPDAQPFVEHCIELLAQLNAQRDAMQNNFDYQKEAFLREMFNHEYGYCGDPDYEVLQVFGNIQYHGNEEMALTAYFDELGFSEVQRKAYRAAVDEYWKRCNL